MISIKPEEKVKGLEEESQKNALLSPTQNLAIKRLLNL